MAMAESTRHAAHGDGGWPGPGSGYEMHFTAKLRKNPPPRSPARGTLGSTTTTSCRSSEERGLTVSLASGRRSGYSGTLWSRSSTPLRLCRCSMLLCRWWDSWWKSSRSLTCWCLTSSIALEVTQDCSASVASSASRWCGAPPRHGSACGRQASHSHGGPAMLLRPREARCCPHE